MPVPALAAAIPYQQVLAAARAVIADPETSWPIESWRVPALAAAQLCLNRSAGTGREQAAVDRFDRQAMRAFNVLSGGTVLRKASKGSRSPRGSVLTGHAEFWAPAAWKAAEEAHAAAQGARRDTERRWQQVQAALLAAGIVSLPGTRSTAPPRLSLEDFERLAALLPDPQAAAPLPAALRAPPSGEWVLRRALLPSFPGEILATGTEAEVRNAATAQRRCDAATYPDLIIIAPDGSREVLAVISGTSVTAWLEVPQ
jgi:hypothetical protein